MLWNRKKMSSSVLSWEEAAPYILSNMTVVERNEFETVEDYVDAVLFYISKMYPSLFRPKEGPITGEPAFVEPACPREEKGESLCVKFEDFRLINLLLRHAGSGVSRVTALFIQMNMAELAKRVVAENELATEVRFWGVIRESADCSYYVAKVSYRTGEFKYYYKSRLDMYRDAWLDHLREMPEDGAVTIEGPRGERTVYFPTQTCGGVTVPEKCNGYEIISVL